VSKREGEAVYPVTAKDLIADPCSLFFEEISQ
jgi:hypothetical protein